MQSINIIKIKSRRPAYVRAGLRFSGKGREFPADQEAFDNWPAALGDPVLLTPTQLETLEGDSVLIVKEGTLDVPSTAAEKSKATKVANGQDVFDELAGNLPRNANEAFDKSWADEAVSLLKAGFKHAGVKATHVKVTVSSEDTAEATAKIGGEVLTSLIDFTGAVDNVKPGGDA